MSQKRASLVEQLKQHLKRMAAARRKAVAAGGGAAAGGAKSTAQAAAPGSPAAGAAAAAGTGTAAASAAAKAPSGAGTPSPKPTPAQQQPDNALLLARIAALQKMVEGLANKAAVAAAAAPPPSAPVSALAVSVDDRTVASVAGPSPSASPEPPMFVVPSTGLRPVLDESGQPLPVVSVTRVEATRAAAPPRPRLRSARMQQDEASAWPPSLLREGDGPLPR